MKIDGRKVICSGAPPIFHFAPAFRKLIVNSFSLVGANGEEMHIFAFYI